MRVAVVDSSRAEFADSQAFAAVVALWTGWYWKNYHSCTDNGDGGYTVERSKTRRKFWTLLCGAKTVSNTVTVTPLVSSNQHASQEMGSSHIQGGEVAQGQIFTAKDACGSQKTNLPYLINGIVQLGYLEQEHLPQGNHFGEAVHVGDEAAPKL
eukprot:Protomagalhaensia_sp_Gyna_25__867@NODE_1419_length_1853_cov_15_600331_g1144_i0_p2_GENE_NODE_1419_length_1853_cov_15_600331_g1144_i0NODE_1419_length_1853_cov_15_600331_g1144_i0_p2_ORF_typecomplete_len154_score14_84_NODE_1419_length_1853_cov_15_600331_g1144_i013161777